VVDDEQDFYGREYWYSGQTTSVGANTIEMRARTDLVDRVPHWVRTLLARKQPPARVLELGSSHGGLVALLRLAGFDATGLEISPAIVDLARRTFDVPMLQGPIEDQDLAPASFDAVVLMDVLEHLPDPAGTLAGVARVIKPDGVVLIQTPEYPGGTFAELKERGSRFVEMLIPTEHLYLFGRNSVTQLLADAGFPYLTFETAVFGHYDMFAVASREPHPASAAAISETLERSPGGRIVLGLLDLDDARAQAERQCAAIPPLRADVAYLIEQVHACEADRAARLRVIQEQAADLGRSTAVVAELEGRLRSVEAQLAASEEDRAARLEVIRSQGKEIGRLLGRPPGAAGSFRRSPRPPGKRTSMTESVGARATDEDVQTRLSRLEAGWAEMETERSASEEDAEALALELDTLRRDIAEVTQLVDAVRAGSLMKIVRRLRPAGVDAALARATEILNRTSVIQGADAARHPAAGPGIGTPPADALSAQIRDPKTTAPFDYTPEALAAIGQGLKTHGFEVNDIKVDPAAYRAYFEAAGYAQRYPNYYSFNLPEKSLEHFVAAQLLGLSAHDIYVDIASEHSPVPEIYSRLFGCVSYRQDLAYRPGLHGDEIGGDAAAMPVPDGFATAMALHCSFEHFEGDADERFIREIKRVLRPGGRVCFAPLYLWHEYGVLTDPAVALAEGVEFNRDAVVYCKPGWGNRHGRLYDPANLDSRIRRNLDGMQMTLYRIVNAIDVHESCYLQFALTISRP
jgi:SAM-dependent methyltransferase